jgi:squalene-hopene/tetraprenyl-beta-curcumene cyclase
MSVRAAGFPPSSEAGPQRFGGEAAKSGDLMTHTTAVRASSRVDVAAERALAKARVNLLAQQQTAGWWKGELETNVTMDAEDLLLREFLGVRDEATTAAAATWIRSQQLADGSWTTFFGGPGDLSTTVEAYAALRLAGDPPLAEHMQRAAAFVRDAGGLEHSRVFTRVWLALFGLWPWDALPALPPEVILLPTWCPFNVYDFACWARQTVVPLTIVAAHRPTRPLPFRVDELRSGGSEPARARELTRWGRRLHALDRALHAYDRHAVRALRRRALARAAEWVIQRQEDDGSWGGIQPPWVYSVLALNVLGYRLDHPVVERGLAGLDGFVIEEDGVRRLEACQSPVWDTALAVVALSDAGIPANDEALVRAADWLLAEEVAVCGDWAVARPNVAPGGWAFEFANDYYPDLDDTAEVVLALRRVAHPDPARVDAAVARAVEWTRGMQCRDGGWAAFDADNDRRAVAELPFCDFGEVIDPPSADVTAHVVEMLAHEGHGADRETTRGIDWLTREQERDGSWFGRWGVNHVYGTGAVVPALRATGVAPNDARIARAVRWLEDHQNADGGWGEDIRSYRDPDWIGRGPTTASQTAWALLALRAAGERSEAVERGVQWLADHQQADGSWDEPQFTGTGFPGDFSINYHLYRLIFPVMALGRLVGGGQ